MAFFRNIISYVEPYLVFPDIIINILDIAILTFLIYTLLKYITRTTAEQVVKGLLLLLLCTWLTGIIGLSTLNWVLRNILSVGVIAIVVLFQPELRRMLEKFGRLSFLGLDISKTTPSEAAKLADSIVAVAQQLSEQKLGALIIIENQTGLNEYLKSGIEVDSVVTEELLGNIFTHNAPLHDGAVIIRGGRIAAAGCMLPLTQNRFLSSQLGMRHRAAIGITEVTDALSVVVSEETGFISIAENGVLFRDIDVQRLRERLLETFTVETQEKKNWLSIFKGRGSNEKHQ